MGRVTAIEHGLSEEERCRLTSDALDVEVKNQFLERLPRRTGRDPHAKMDRLPAYLGGDSNSQKDVSHFMRELMNPLLQRHQVGMILAHHTDKPFRGKKKDHWEAGDYAYLGAGSPLDRFLDPMSSPARPSGPWTRTRPRTRLRHRSGSHNAGAPCSHEDSPTASGCELALAEPAAHLHPSPLTGMDRMALV
jgi:hypothetical protein